MFCTDCGQECEVIEFDDGIGPYEYWGQIGNQVCMVEASDCCLAAVVEEAAQAGEDEG